MKMIELLEKRRSVRSFLKKELPTEIINKLRSEVTYINSHEAGLNFQLAIGDGTPFEGFRRSYGMFRNVSNYLMAIIDPTFEYAEERAGYMAEKFVIELVKLGLGSCFVGATFSRNDITAQPEVYEKIPFVVAFGYEDADNTSLMGKLTSAMAHRKEKSIDSFLRNPDESRKLASKAGIDLDLALKAVQCAPSALNRQPVRLSVKECNGKVNLYAEVEDYKKNAVDLGIAKCNIALAIPGEWQWGNNAPVFIYE